MAFSKLRNESYLHNVTLVSNDNHQVSAHKLVLSACSEYFYYIFKNNANAHPFFCIDGVNKEDLNKIMDYMYNGEVQVFQDELDRFLSFAERFKLQGLITGFGGSHKGTVEDQSDTKEDIHSQVDNTTVIETNSLEKMTQNVSQAEISPFEKMSMLNEIEEKISQHVEKLDNRMYRCSLCGKEANHIRNLKNHIETHLSGFSFPCGTCGKTFRSRIVLINHKKIHKTRL